MLGASQEALTELEKWNGAPFLKSLKIVHMGSNSQGTIPKSLRRSHSRSSLSRPPWRGSEGLGHASPYWSTLTLDQPHHPLRTFPSAPSRRSEPISRSPYSHSQRCHPPQRCPYSSNATRGASSTSVVIARPAVRNGHRNTVEDPRGTALYKVQCHRTVSLPLSPIRLFRCHIAPASHPRHLRPITLRNRSNSCQV